MILCKCDCDSEVKKRNTFVHGHNWKGGISINEYCELFSNKEFREMIFERDGYICLKPACSKKSSHLYIHHINYNKKDCSNFNLISICVCCNSEANFERDWHQSWYDAILRRRYYDQQNTSLRPY